MSHLKNFELRVRLCTKHKSGNSNESISTLSNFAKCFLEFFPGLENILYIPNSANSFNGNCAFLKKNKNVEIFIQFPHQGNFLLYKSNSCCGNYSRGETIQVRKLFAKIWREFFNNNHDSTRHGYNNSKFGITYKIIRAQ